MERVRRLLRQEPDYEPIHDSGTVEREDSNERLPKDNTPSSIDYAVFVLLGISMLWAWNMFLAAGPYLQGRFRSSTWIFKNFQSTELLVSTIAMLGGMFILTKLQANASYPRRIITSLLINMVAFFLLALSTRFFLDTSAQSYFAFIVLAVFCSSTATAFCQNGVFAYVTGFGTPQYTQAIMTGQGIAGVLPCIAQIVLVLSIPEQSSVDLDDESARPLTPGRAAFGYFLTATAISGLTLAAFTYLLRRHRTPPSTVDQTQSSDDLSPSPTKKTVPLKLLLRKLLFLALAVFTTFVVTMVFPVYTQQILSVQNTPSSSPDPTPRSRLLAPSCFIPLAFLFWNTGDLIGRLIPAIPKFRLTHRPRLLFALSLARVIWIPLYSLCNIRGEGAKIHSDAFYLIIVQALFGMSNGYIGSSCMMGAGEWVEEDEREAAGSFMGLCLALGLAVGSGFSFLVAR